MDYSKLSDFEINRRVFSLAMNGRDWNRQGSGVFDFCNNPADAWPIILANKINIRFGAEGFRHEAQFIQYGRESVEAYHENPLRAAMIVFLKMQESQKCQNSLRTR
ncbi:phage protein NinX family protein [Klebsiella quasipneumoniae]